MEAAITTLRELGLSYEDAARLISDVNSDLKDFKSLWGKPGVKNLKSSNLIKIGVSLIAFPIPTIGIKKSLGAMLIAAGLAQQRMKRIQIVDVYSTFKDTKEKLQKLRREMI